MSDGAWPNGAWNSGSPDAPGPAEYVTVPLPPTRGPAFWVGLGVLVIGLVLGVASVPFVNSSVQRSQALGRYAEASTKAGFAATLGDETVVTAQELAGLTQLDAASAPAMRQFLLSGDSFRFNLSNEDVNGRRSAEEDAYRQLASSADRLADVLAVDGAIKETLNAAVAEGDTPGGILGFPLDQ
ncbi:hypothetical protein E3T26_06175 [Cryobacterium sp. TMT1-21]|uniref:Uncharacterized protein n=1 Tax=Cryobacterium shii TaxID=1259235 RepID=A0AAQ2C8L2_9MICO|nr:MULTISPECIES: hypothetical protein [Cryobacterium]TFC52192.1 hypothetical protein E3O49_02650 [Cryobacterium shii]TFC84745.1 hypothetical protein E3T24_09930 [Cryobacterium sp. TmT2-59]TFD14530.1 hypothetical protein E3T42_11800 [Cryobacterium sp. TMT4-10]TFD15681.1 hypothetical protein E3T26_06175 [Cryobacterium sp. TMT1-21]TFD18980.1 hypothetical protein E3T32_11425 [Cryobacterium sp. TMT2-23]